METKGVRMEKKSFMLSFFFIFLMMVAVYILTLVIPGGQYARVADGNGNMIIDISAGFTEVQGGNGWRRPSWCCLRRDPPR